MWKTTHEMAVRIGGEFKKSESALIEILQKVEEERVYEQLGITSLYRYCLTVLKLTEEQSLTYIRIARVSKHIPALKEAIDNKTLSISNAKKIAAVMTEETQTEWIQKGETLSCRELEKEIVKTHPKEMFPEKIKPLTESLYEVRCLLSPKAEKLLQRLLEISGKKMGEALEQVLEEYVIRHDPLQKAKRASKKKSHAPVTGKAVTNGKRKAIPRPLVHAAMKESNGECSIKGCHNRKYLNIHHCEPVAYGGKHELSNLKVLCYEHHRIEHRDEFPKTGP